MDATAPAVVAVGFSIFALVVVVAVAVRVGRLLRAYDGLVAGGAAAGFVEAVGRQTTLVRQLSGEVADLRTELAAARDQVGDGLRHVAVVRYDAFGDLGGMMSFSAALLDDAGNGLVLTAINGRSESRTYAKGLQCGASAHPLSPEELDAIAEARATR